MPLSLAASKLLSVYRWWPGCHSSITFFCVTIQFSLETVDIQVDLGLAQTLFSRLFAGYYIKAVRKNLSHTLVHYLINICWPCTSKFWITELNRFTGKFHYQQMIYNSLIYLQERKSTVLGNENDLTTFTSITFTRKAN